MKKITLLSIVTIVLLLFSTVSFSQTLKLGDPDADYPILADHAIYTGKGAVTSNGQVLGDAGTNDGIISGSAFGAGYCCQTHRNGDTTYQARIDLLRVYIHLSDVFVNFPNSHAPAFGGDESIFPGVYSIPSGGSIDGNLTLNGNDDPNAYFIFKFDGALTAAVGSKIILDGVRAANVFWIAEGAITIGASSILKGSFISHPGAITVGLNASVEGRLFSTEGAISAGINSNVYMPEGDSTIPISCLGGCEANPLVDVLGSVSQYALFTSDGAVANAATSGIVGNIGTNNGLITGFTTSTHAGFFNIPGDITFKAKQDLAYAYAQLIAIPNTELGHTAAFGSGERVFPGVYKINGAGSLAGTITLDAQNNPDAIFIFKFNGAFSVEAQSKVIFRNGTRRCNVFWISEGATDIGTFTYMKGTVIAHGGAATMEANGNLEGRLLSTAGAVNFSTGVVYNDTLCFEPITVEAQDYEGCIEDTPILTSTATVSTTSQNVKWYDAETGGNIVTSPTLTIAGTITYWARAYNGAYYSDNIASSTLTLVDCSLVINAMDDTYRPIQVVDEITTFENLVTANDTLDNIPVTTDNGVVTAVTDGPLSIDENGTLSLEANTEPGTYTIMYTLCQYGSNATNCDTATVTVIVAIIDAVDDITEPVNGLTGGDTEPLTLNDTITIDAEVAVVVGTEPGNVILTGLTAPEGFTVPEGFTLNEDGTVNIAPNTPAGEYPVIYQICEVDNPINCDSANATIVVSAPVIDAVDDTTEEVNGLTGGNTTALTLNDTLNEIAVVIGEEPGNVTLTGLTAPEGSTVPEGLSLNEDGTVAIAPNTPAGEYPVIYQICEVDNPINCDSANATIVVSAPVIDAVDDTTDPVNGLTGGNTTALTLNDTLNEVAVVIGDEPGNVILTGLTAPEGLTVPEGLSLNEDGTVTIDPNTPAGEYPVIYKICEVNNPDNCDSATATIVVSAPFIDAVDDTTEPVNGLTGGNTTSLTLNDTLNDEPVVIGEDPGNVTIGALVLPIGFILNGDGTVTVPENTPAGGYLVIYQICEVNNPTNCDSANATIVVSAPIIDAVIDNVGPINGLTGGNTTALTVNDTLNGDPVVIGTNPGDVILTGLNVPVGLTLNTNGTVTIAPNTPVGNYPVEYQICEVSNPGNCDSVISTIVVSAPIIDAVIDTVGPINGATGGDTTALTVNDTLNGDPVVIGTNPGDVILTGLTVPFGFTLNTDGTVTIPANTPAGEYEVEYQICDVNNSTANCDSVTSTIVVSAPSIDAVVDITTPINGLTGGNTDPLTNNDTLNGDPVVIGTQPGNVILTGLSVPLGLTLNTNGTVTIAPNTPAGDYLVEYQICDANNSTNCDSVTSTIQVSAPDIEAVVDTLGPVNGTSGETTTSLTTNDTLNGIQVVIGTQPGNVILTEISIPQGFTLNTDGTVTVPANTSAGEYEVIYQICEVTNPGNCDSVISIIEVEAPSIEAVDDTVGPINGTTGGVDVINVLTNDLLNGSAVNLADVVLSPMTLNVFLDFNPNGSIDVFPNTPTGTYTMIYQICDVNNTGNCSQADVSIEVFRETPDFTPTIDIDALVFLPDGEAKDLIVNVAEVKGAPSDGPVVLKITKGNAFVIAYNASTTNSNVNGGTGTPVNNDDWIISEDAFIITMTLKPGKTIAANSFSSIGFSINRGSDVPTQTNQSITVTIVNGSGGDSEVFNNTYNTVVKAQ